MIELNSKVWSELDHAYGRASDIPQLLRALETATYPAENESEPWFSLWSSLCHQYSIYTASYAAVPHLVRITKVKESTIQLRILELISTIHCLRIGKGQPAIPESLLSSYEKAIRDCAGLCSSLVEGHFSEEDTKSLLGSIATFSGHSKLAAMIFDMQEEIECSDCGAFIDAPGLDLVKTT